jgi:Protein Family FAM60A
MFSFHKPKVYRSTTGCCICKAKSSSSRFTDSKKYEVDFIECFHLDVPRRGEICNACVLLVKRFKRLPPGSDRHWGHVVDARVGPGLKSMTKFKKRKEEQKMQTDGMNGEKLSYGTKGAISVPERFCKIFKKKKKLRNPDDMLQIEIKKDGECVWHLVFILFY